MRKKFGANNTVLLAIVFLIFFIFLNERVSSQSYTYTISNDIQTSDRTMEFDLYLLNTNPDVPVEISVAQAGILLNPAIVNGGIVTASFVAGASQMVSSQVPTAITYSSSSSCIKIAAKAPPGCGSGTVISSTGLGTRLCRVKLTNTVAFAVVKANLTFNFTAIPYNTFFGKYRPDCTGSDALSIDETLAFSLANNATLNGIPVSISGVTANSKVYDGTRTATFSGGTLSGVIGTDEVTIVAGTGTFSDKNVGTSKTVLAHGYTLSGSDAQYYSLTAQPSGMTADITTKGLTISGVIAADKPYDGTTAATLTGGSLVGVISPDVVTISEGTGAFSDKNVGDSKIVTATGYSITGTNAANYILSEQPTGLTADITAPSSVQLNVKIYYQGLWNSSNSNMNRCKVADGITTKFEGTIVDTVSIELHDATNYATIVYRAYGLELYQDGNIKSTGLDYISIPAIYTGSYYITVVKRSFIDVTSATAVSFATAPSYDFTTSVSKAYGNNQKLLATGVYSVPNGDINRDGLVNGTDLSTTNAALLQIRKGYVSTDMNGDGLVNGTDLSIVNAALLQIVKRMTP